MCSFDIVSDCFPPSHGKHCCCNSPSFRSLWWNKETCLMRILQKEGSGFQHWSEPTGTACFSYAPSPTALQLILTPRAAGCLAASSLGASQTRFRPFWDGGPSFCSCRLIKRMKLFPSKDIAVSDTFLSCFLGGGCVTHWALYRSVHSFHLLWRELSLISGFTVSS